MIKKIFKGIWLLCVVSATIGGTISFYHELLAEDDYALTLYLKDSVKVIENNKETPGLSILFDGAEISSLYLSSVQIQNSGRRALTKDFIYEPLIIEIGAINKILQINPPIPFVTHTENMITIRWDLLNPNEVIKLSLFTSGPIDIKTSHKIKDISDINFVNEVANPPINKKLKSISVIWFFLLFYSIAITFDAIFLILKDLKLGSVLVFVKTLPEIRNLNKEAFLAELSSLYDDYYRSVHLLFVSPEELIAYVSKRLNSSEISEKELEKISTETLQMVIHGNLYTLRSRSIYIGPVLFCFSIIVIGLSLFF